MPKVYLSPSMQEDNKGVGEFGSEMLRAYQVARLVEDYLTPKGCRVRLPDKAWATLAPSTTLAKVTNDSNEWRASVHVCLHTNAASDPKVGGTGIWHHPESDAGHRLATLIYKRLAVVSPGEDKGLFHNPVFYETSHAHAPVAYIEAVFHTNPAEAKDYVFARKLYAWAIAAGILEFLDLDVPVKPLASFQKIVVPVPMRPAPWWGELQDYLARVDKTG